MLSVCGFVKNSRSINIQFCTSNKRSILNRLINYNINDKVENVLYEVVVSIIDVLLCQL